MQGARAFSLRFFLAAFLCCTLALGFEAPASASASQGFTNVCRAAPPHDSAPSAGGVANSPLTVDATSHIVVMEYEAWFGPATSIHPQASVTTCLQSRDMQSTGGGYDSTSPGVIAQHVAWLERMGTDAVTLDLTNDVSCMYDGDNPKIIAQMCPDPTFRSHLLHIRDNDVRLYPAWAQLQTPLKILPLLGGFDRFALTPDRDDPHLRTALEKEADDFASRMTTFPGSTVLYRDKPTMLIYLGTPVDVRRASAIRKMLSVTGLDRRFTFELIGGYLDSQAQLWAEPNETPTGPIEIAPRFGFWSVVDRLNFWGAPPAPYFPTFNRAGGRVENMTASLATAGQTGWLCPTQDGPRYCPDAALRYCGEGYAHGCDPRRYETLHEFMSYARTLRPIFLIIDQFNEFAIPDEGPNANTNDDVEPTRQWGYSGIQAITGEIGDYRKAVGGR